MSGMFVDLYPFWCNDDEHLAQRWIQCTNGKPRIKIRFFAWWMITMRKTQMEVMYTQKTINTVWLIMTHKVDFRKHLNPQSLHLVSKPVRDNRGVILWHEKGRTEQLQHNSKSTENAWCWIKIVFSCYHVTGSIVCQHIVTSSSIPPKIT